MIQFIKERNLVYVGEKVYPAKPASPDWDGAFRIPIGESGVVLSVAIGPGSYSDNYRVDEDSFDSSVPLEMVELGFFQSNGTIEVMGWQNADSVNEVIQKMVEATTMKELS